MNRAVLIFFFFAALVSSEIVEIENGKISGTTFRSRAGNNLFVFNRIPYATPPLDKLRFRAPQPVRNWDGVFDATQGVVSCYQTTQMRTDIPMSEDCLHINIFTKNVTDLKPVIVWIHGGALEIGSGAVDVIPELLDLDVVLVTFNYRLASLGFLAMGSKEIPGNAGMKDQVSALRWIQKNIGKFGGNKNLVTILGHSSGGTSVTAHLASPMSANLFHRAITMSGAITMTSELRRNNLDAVEKLGKTLNCSSNVYKCLIEAPANLLMTEVKDIPSCQILQWLPVIEDDFGQERFFVEDPTKSFRSGNFNKAPVIAGRAEYEFEFLIGGYSNSFMNDFYNDFYNLAPKCFCYWENETKSNKMSEILKQKLLPAAILDENLSEKISATISDGFIGYPIYKFVESISNFTDVYFYNSPGCQHNDELYYFIPNFNHIMSSHLMRIIESFSLTGNPNYDPKTFHWGKYKIHNKTYLEFSHALKEKTELFADRYKLWDEMSEL